MEPILEPILGPERPKRGQDEPKRAIRSFKEPKSCIFKNLKNLCFSRFLGPETSQESLKRPKKAPKRHPKSSKTPQKRDPKMDPKINNFWTSFGSILGPILGSKTAPKRDQQWDHFWDPLAPALRVRETPNREINESGEKPTGAGFILSKRKGGIKPLRPYEALNIRTLAGGRNLI